MSLLLLFQRLSGNLGQHKSAVIRKPIRRRCAIGLQHFTESALNTFYRHPEPPKLSILPPVCLTVARWQSLNPASAITVDHSMRWIVNAGMSPCLGPCGLSRSKNGLIYWSRLMLSSLEIRITQRDHSSVEPASSACLGKDGNVPRAGSLTKHSSNSLRTLKTRPFFRWLKSFLRSSLSGL